MSQRPRLLHRPIRSANEVLILAGFDPEMRRKIGHIRKYGYVGNLRQRGAQAFIHGAIKIRHHRNDHVGTGLFPVFCKQANGGPVIQPDDRMHKHQALRRAQRPTLRQHQVVNVFQPNARDFLENIQRIEHFLQIDQLNIPRPPLRFGHCFQSRGRRAVTAPRVEINEVHFRSKQSSHDCFIAASLPCHTKGL